MGAGAGGADDSQGGRARAGRHGRRAQSQARRGEAVAWDVAICLDRQ